MQYVEVINESIKNNPNYRCHWQRKKEKKKRFKQSRQP